jgi:DNA-binding response OmpR family regulator
LRVLRELKDNRKSDGVIIVSAKNSIDDKINGLRIGADDYLPKPFHLSELSARIAAIIRRKQFTGNNLVSFNELAIDTLSKEVRVHDHILDLTRKEYQLLLYFIVNKGRVISRNAIAEHLWGAELDLSGSLDFIYTHIKNLRKKLHEAGANDYIRSLYGMGYKFTE